MINRIVTIRREFGNSGRTIGKTAAKELCIPCHDAEQLQELSKKIGFAEDCIKRLNEVRSFFAAMIFSISPKFTLAFC